MPRFIKPKLSSEEIDSLMREGYNNLNPYHIIKNVLRILGVTQKDYSLYLGKNPNYISDRMSNWYGKRFTVKDVQTLKYFVESQFINLKFDNIVRDILQIDGLESLSSASVIRRYEMVIKELMEANQFNYYEYEALLSGSNAWAIGSRNKKSS